MPRRTKDLSTPTTGNLSLGVYHDPDAFGRFSETIARYIGTARFLVIQTVIVISWIAINVFTDVLQFDEYPFIFLTLALSLQAAYTAPLILLAQSRQEERDARAFQSDRERAELMNASLDYLARELAAVRISVVTAPTHEEIEKIVATSIRQANEAAERQRRTED